MSKLKSIYTEATTRKTVQQVELIENPEEVQKGLDGLLLLKGGKRRILVCKGYDAMTAVFQTYLFLANQFDEQGEPVFKMSKKVRGLVWVDKQWGSWEKVRGVDLIEYLSSHFAPAQLVSKAGGEQVLLLMSEFPIQFAGTLMQTRFSANFGDLFVWLD